jgi:hypothetical protein
MQLMTDVVGVWQADTKPAKCYGEQLLLLIQL